MCKQLRIVLPNEPGEAAGALRQLLNASPDFNVLGYMLADLGDAGVRCLVSYSFSVNVSKYDCAKQFADYRHLLARGTLLRPRQIAVDSVELIFLPSVGPREMER